MSATERASEACCALSRSISSRISFEPSARRDGETLVTDVWESSDNTRSLSGPSASARKLKRVSSCVVQHGADVVVRKLLAAFQEIELDEKAQRFDFATDFLDEIGDAARGAAGGKDVIDDDDALA